MEDSVMGVAGVVDAGTEARMRLTFSRLYCRGRYVLIIPNVCSFFSATWESVMSTRVRRYVVALVAVVLMIVVAASRKQAEPPRHVFRITVGLKDKKSTDWSGKVEISGGEIASITGWRFEEKDAVDGVRGWKCRTHENIALGERFPIASASGNVPQPPKQPWPNGVTLTVRGESPVLTITLPAGTIKFKTEEVPLGEAKIYLNDRVRVERLPQTSVLRPAAAPRAENPVQDDYPAFWVRYKTGKQYLAWVAYRQQKDRVLLVERDGPDGAWSEPKEVDRRGRSLPRRRGQHARR